jgi:hypothetical protein
LAADGAKLALWELRKKGLRITNFIHDEVLAELPEGSIDDLNQEVHDIERTMIDAMRQVLPDIDVKAESALMDRWYKADGMRDSAGRLVVITEAMIEAEQAKKKKK